jgi:leucyl-tRNA synthetase
LSRRTLDPISLEKRPAMRPERYNVRESEPKWRKAWADAQVFKTRNDDPRPKYYVLEMFPYPSGRIHVGHVRNYVMGDVVARYRRARGFNVLHPMGWDAFGLPAENAAAQYNTHPAKWTYANIATMRAQLQSMGLSLDWSREIATCDPNYYKHQQKLFLDFLAAGLVTRKKSKVNWDPVDQTVLANEQVIDGRGWRSGAVVEQRELTQWFFKITEYSDDLLTSLDRLDRWPEKVRLMQRNWIGRSEGLLVRFVVDPKTLGALAGEPETSELEIYTTRPDTLFGAKFMAIAPDHPLAGAAARRDPALAAFIAECRRIGTSVAAIETAEKRGYDTGLRVVHPFDADWRLPVYVANFVLMEYGTGAIFGCPGHDQRDLDFVNAYGLGATPVVAPPGADPATFTVDKIAYDGAGLMINSRFLNGMTVEEAKEEVARRLEQTMLGDRPQGKRQINYKLRDWGVSRQRYWGCPIPVIHCEACGVSPVPAKDLPVTLPDDVTFDQPGNPLDRHPTWKHVACPQCARRTRWIRSSIRPGISCASPIRPIRRPRPIGQQPTIGWRSTSTSAASSTRSCIFCTRVSSLARCAGAGTSISMSLSPAFSRRAWWCTRPIATSAGNGWRRPKFASKRTGRGVALFCSRAPRPSRSARSRRCRNPSATRSIPTRSSRPMAPTRRDGSCCRIRPRSAT